jgi:3'-5' exonuclease
MSEQYDLANILFLDIETVPQVWDFDELDERIQELWAHKYAQISKTPLDSLMQDQIAAGFQEKAGIYAEFGKICCISVGILSKPKDGGTPIFRLKSFAHDNEAILLDDFAQLLEKRFNNPDKFALCGHNIKEFDIPFICRRMLINQLPFPKILEISGKKPWELKHFLDTLELWKFGDYKNYTSLKLLTAIFGIPSPKDDIDGSMVAATYWENRELDRIAAYCEKDVLATAQLFCKFRRLPLFEADQVVFVGR